MNARDYIHCNKILKTKRRCNVKKFGNHCLRLITLCKSTCQSDITCKLWKLKCNLLPKLHFWSEIFSVLQIQCVIWNSTHASFLGFYHLWWSKHIETSYKNHIEFMYVFVTCYHINFTPQLTVICQTKMLCAIMMLFSVLQ
jgi:hypothetical protein